MVKDPYSQTLRRLDPATTFTAISCQLRSPTSDLPSPQGREKLLCGSSQKRSSSVSEIRRFLLGMPHSNNIDDQIFFIF